MKRISASSTALAVVLLAASAPLFYAAHQLETARRFEIGSMDRDFLADPEAFSGPSAMSGPVRHEDGTVDVIDFYGRVTARRAVLRLPYHALRSPLELFLRCHRFGLRGTVSLAVNGTKLDDFAFAKTSYPWGGIRAVIPQGVAEEGPLEIELVATGGDPAPSHLPPDTGVGLDHVEIAPMSEGAVIRPSLGAYLAFYAFLLSGLAFGLVSGLSAARSLGLLVALAAVTLASVAFFPVPAGVALSRLWIVFPFAASVHLLLRRALRIEPGDARFLSRLVALAMLFHSLLIFFPNHLPPDVPLHANQVSWLSSVDISYSGLVDYSRALSRNITSEAVLMGTGESPEAAEPDEPEEPSLGAPYPPFFYLLAYLVSPTLADLRFVLELLSVAMASLLLVLVFLTALAIWRDSRTARLAAVLFCLEIAVWHHASRGHAPGLFGALFVMAFVWFLTSFASSLRTRFGLAGFALLTAVVALCYTVALIQISIFVAVLAVLLLASREAELLPRMLGGFTAGIAIAVLLFYAPYLVEAAIFSPSDGAVLASADYDPPATFYFLRNQLRDTARLLANGHALYVLLSVVGLGLLAGSGASRYHRTILWAAVGTYVLMLILKDPAFLPRVFLHAKEDLFYSPFACMLSALPMRRLWARRAVRPIPILVLAALAGLSLRDKAWNADTLHPQPLERAARTAS